MRKNTLHFQLVHLYAYLLIARCLMNSSKVGWVRHRGLILLTIKRFEGTALMIRPRSTLCGQLKEKQDPCTTPRIVRNYWGFLITVKFLFLFVGVFYFFRFHVPFKSDFSVEPSVLEIVSWKVDQKAPPLFLQCATVASSLWV